MFPSQNNLLLKSDYSDGSVHPDGLANDLVKDILRNHPERGLHAESDSTEPPSWVVCSAESKSRVDRRLEYWKNMLAQRRALQQRLRRQMGRAPQQMMLPRPSLAKSLAVSGFKEGVGLPRHSLTQAEVMELEPLSKAPKEDLFQQEELDVKIQESEGEPVKCGDCCTGLCVRINGMHYRPKVPEFPPIVETYFICDPFQRLLRTVIRIENSGCHKLHFSWRMTQFFPNNDTLFKAEPGDFVFDTDSFLLAPGAVRDVSVLYQPRCVAIVKQRWLLVPRPQLFLCRPCGITLNLHGCCTAPKEFLERLAMDRPPKPTLLKFRLPLDEPALCVSPYVRELEEREAFEERNRSFQCRRHEDMERLKKFFELVRPQNCLLGWNFSVHTLIHLVCAVKDAQQRIRLFSELTHLLKGLRGVPGQPMSVEDTPHRLRERRHTKLLYVRGILSSRLQEWDDKVQYLRERNSRAPDSIYMLLYELIAQAAEDIVSVIESTIEI